MGGISLLANALLRGSSVIYTFSIRFVGTEKKAKDVCALYPRRHPRDVGRVAPLPPAPAGAWISFRCDAFTLQLIRCSVTHGERRRAKKETRTGNAKVERACDGKS